MTGLGGPAPYWRGWTYDPTGSRATEVRHATGGDTTLTYTAPASGPGSIRPHSLSSVTASGPGTPWTRNYTYDNAGNTTTRPADTGAQQSLTWDAEGHLDTVTGPGGTTTRYLYDADGNRLLRKDSTGGKVLYLGGTEVTVAGTGASATATRYYSAGDTVYAMRTSAALTWLTSDHHGTAEVCVNAANLTVTRRRTMPFGEERGTPTNGWPTAMDKGCVGGTKDPTGLVHLGAREYDPGSGRFISVDPALTLDDPQQMGGYAYSGNSPVTATDPAGLYSCAGRQEGDLCAGNTRGAWAPNDDAARERRFGDGHGGRKTDNSYTGHWRRRPLPPPATCAAQTPEYCHAPGSRPEQSYDLGYQWRDRELDGLTDPCVSTTRDSCAEVLYFREGDAFTKELWNSMNFDYTLNRIMADVDAGLETGDASFHYSEMPTSAVLGHMARDGVSVFTGGGAGSTRADSFLGSFDVSWSIVGNDELGNPVVEVHMRNATTVSSGTWLPSLKNPGDGRAGSGADRGLGERYQVQSMRFRITL